MTERQRVRRIRVWLAVFVCGLVVAGVTAFPLEFETRLIADWLQGPGAGLARHVPAVAAWLEFVHQGLASSYARYPFLAYGTDWLAFGHLTIAVAFAGPIRDPVRNKWVVEFGMIACVMVVPLALICGPLREIPAFWTPVDISFGVIGIVPLALAYRHIVFFERQQLSGPEPGGSVEEGPSAARLHHERLARPGHRRERAGSTLRPCRGLGYGGDVRLSRPSLGCRHRR
jgi:hypothetical protein